MLYLIGIGLREKDITLAALDAIKSCDKIYAEHYTGCTDIRCIENIIGKKIEILDRTKVESDFLIKEAEQSNAALLVPGDPLVATTHMELIMEAKKQNIDTKVIHAPSIFTAIAECGLQLYKFGRTATLARPLKNYSPESPYDTIIENKKSCLHSLLLLEIDMPAKEAVEILKNIEAKRNGNIMKEKIISIYFGEENKVQYSNADSLDLPAPCCLIIPGQLHFKEEEALQLW